MGSEVHFFQAFLLACARKSSTKSTHSEICLGNNYFVLSCAMWKGLFNAALR
jgi:hypothetical protein